MKFTFDEIIKILPLDDTTREDLMKNMMTYSPDRQTEIQSICWDAFSEMTEKLTDLKFEKMMIDVQEGNMKLETNMEDLAEEAVYEDYKKILSGQREENSQIDDIRNKLQGLIQTSK